MNSKFETWKVIVENFELFDSEYYLSENKDLSPSGIDPFWHCMYHGIAENRTYANNERSWVILRKISENIRNKAENPKILIETIFPDLNSDFAIDVSIPDTNVSKTEIGIQEIVNVVGKWVANKNDYSMLAPILPANTRNYWIPQSLRNFTVAKEITSSIDALTKLMDLVSNFSTDVEKFKNLPEFRPFLDWIKIIANQLNSFTKPDVSIILPAYNNIVLTLTAIASVLGNKSKYSYEIIVAPDCSSDGTEEIIDSIGGCVIRANSVQNVGFLKNCNNAAKLARGKYIIMLNNDTIALPEWLDKIIEPFEVDDNIGLVGSKLLNSDGTLQEAGGIYWNDGSAWNFGRNQNPLSSQFNYLKETDYISGAAIALPIDVWKNLGGFDEYYLPAYCEDSDLAFRVRDAGLKVIYSPHSEIIHHEGMTHGRDVTTGMKAYQVTNGKKLFDRWKSVIERDNFPNGKNVLVARDRSRNKPHILIIDHYVPQWDKDAGSRTMLDCLKYFLREGFHITLWPDNLHHDKKYVKILQQMGVEVIYGSEYVNKFEEWWKINGEFYPFAFLWRAHISIKYIDDIKKYHNSKIIYYGGDLPWKRMLQEYEISRNENVKQEALSQKKVEDNVCSKSQIIVYPAVEECDYARANFKNALAVIEMPGLIYEDDLIEKSIAKADNIKHSKSKNAIFVGGFTHTPNVDAVLWFSEAVYPLVKQQVPDFSFTIVGSNAPDEIRSLNSDGIIMKGWVSDSELINLMSISACNVAPLRYGGGVKGKVLNAFAYGIPVVTTNVGMQGLPEGENIAFIGDSPEELARQIVLCITDKELAYVKVCAALDVIKQRYTFAAMKQAFSGVFN